MSARGRRSGPSASSRPNSGAPTVRPPPGLTKPANQTTSGNLPSPQQADAAESRPAEPARLGDDAPAPAESPNGLNKEEELDDEGLTDSNCFICTEPITYYALGACNHRICHICSLRLRALYKIRECPYCKRELQSVVYCKDSTRSFSSFPPRQLPFSDPKLGIRFDSQDVYDDTMVLLRFNCPDPGCEVACPAGWKEIKRHVREVHGKQMCDTCTRHKKVFTHEHALYTPGELRRHTNEGDPPEPGAGGQSFTGHPECGFCHIRFYGSDELYEHCRQKHEECFLCRRRGLLHRYYRDYTALDQHFKDEHYACRQPECLEAKFVVFETDIDLRAHEAEVHNLNRGKVKLDLNITYTSSREGPRAYSEGRPDARSARGGRGGSASSHAVAQPASARPGDRERAPAEARANLRVPEGFGTQLTEPDAPLPGRGGRGGRGGRVRGGGNRGRGAGADDARGGDEAGPGGAEPRTNTTNGSSTQSAAPDFPTLQAGAAAATNPSSAPPSTPEGLPARLMAIFDDDPTRYTQFRSLAQSFKASQITPDDFLGRVADLALEACPPDDHRRRKARITEVGKVWAKMAETAPSDEAPGKRIVPGMPTPLSRQEEMLRAWKDWKVKRDREEEDRRRAEAQTAFANWTGGSNSSPSLGGAGSHRVLVIKSTSARHKLPAAGRAGSSSSAAVLERISQEASQRKRVQDAERTREAQAVWEEGVREENTKVKVVSRLEAEAMRAAIVGDGPSSGNASSNWGPSVGKTTSEFPGLPKTAGVNLRAGRFAGSTSPSLGTKKGGTAADWVASGSGAEASEDSDSISGKDGDKKKGKKKQLLMYVGGQR
ncbi:hypothetical protein M427DRAFT_45557 [Gonapodya prolifera JEL478]|uniref:RING-type E3 ubiquitin transferase n=1 Tax=Gonapodya prolifera (strain JEL478) TaxID=1344416 RepID=A0A139AAW1_GONPJ|nr:hypothetical protein M427DRAFT_45557 [Gonapodya prolifera JEL478]|eukprot:KXS13605.1 hypothetical protein M427DRAFT_45557 [Gonapodya prolifera JEL478]